MVWSRRRRAAPTAWRPPPPLGIWVPHAGHAPRGPAPLPQDARTLSTHLGARVLTTWNTLPRRPLARRARAPPWSGPSFPPSFAMRWSPAHCSFGNKSRRPFPHAYTRRRLLPELHRPPLPPMCCACLSARFWRRPAILAPSLGHARALSLAHCLAPPSHRRNFEPR
jgi:hypothetical protein